MMVSIRRLIVVAGVAALPVFAGCSSNSTNPTPTPTPLSITRLYVANDGGSGVVQIFAPPFSAASTPAVAFQDGTSTDVDDVAFDLTGRLYVGNYMQGKIDVFTAPFTNTSTSSFSVSTTALGPEGIDVDALGNLYVSNRFVPSVTIYNAPLSGTSTAATTISTGLSQPIGLKIRAGVLYVADTTHGYVAIYNPPFSNASAPAITIPVPGAWGLAFDGAGDLWVAIPGSASVEEFVPPFTNTSTPAITISSSLSGPDYPAFDASGNLYVSNVTDVAVFMAPLSNASTSAFDIATIEANGIRFGP
jgi:hypothetical protein